MKLKTLAGSLLFVAAPATAQSLINGEAVRYNFAYRCKGERVIIAHCRDELDSSYCQTVYPDRPYVNGMQVAPVEMRGDVVAKLNACSQVSSASAGRSAPQAPASRAPAKAAASYAKTGKPPGVGKASWLLMDYDDKSATFFTKTGLKRSGAMAEGWFTVVYNKLKKAPGSRLDGAQYFQMRYLADCTRGTTRLAEAAYWNDDMKLLDGAFITPEQSPFSGPAERSLNWEELNIMCGRPQQLVSDKPMVVDGMGLVFTYHGLVQLDEADKRE